MHRFVGEAGVSGGGGGGGGGGIFIPPPSRYKNAGEIFAEQRESFTYILSFSFTKYLQTIYLFVSFHTYLQWMYLINHCGI